MAKKKYDDLSKEELIRLLEARDRRDATRFGLVWEANEIERDKALNQDFVALDLDAELSCPSRAASWKNLIIEGDNFDALRYLKMTFAGRVKCIYIDPPYNTGNKDFVYNDRFVEKEDLWRHSKWCEFMYQRLILARDLLSQDGVILVHIGEEEVDHLGCLMDSIFRRRKVGKFVWRTRSGARVSQNHFLSVDHEYVLCYANPDFEFAGSAKSFADYGNPDADPRGDWANFNLTKGQSFKERPRSFYPLQNPENLVWYAPNPDRVWAFSSEKFIKKGQKLVGLSMEEVIKQKKVLWPQNDKVVTYRSLDELLAAIESGEAPRHLRRDLPNLDEWVGRPIGFGMPRYKMHKYELDATHNPLSTWLRPSGELTDDEQVESLAVGATAEGASLLSSMLGTKTFSYPKPLSLAQSLIEQATRPGDLVLDFFAGSGTTAHAVLNLNAEDAGAVEGRRFILVSNTEQTTGDTERNVCRDICRERVSAAINGYDYSTKSGLLFSARATNQVVR